MLSKELQASLFSSMIDVGGFCVTSICIKVVCISFNAKKLTNMSIVTSSKREFNSWLLCLQMLSKELQAFLFSFTIDVDFYVASICIKLACIDFNAKKLANMN